MANRLYGQKRLDDTEANRFTERLGLPTGWLDVPRSVTDIPESVSDLLVPASRRPVSAQQELPPAIEPTATAGKKPVIKQVRTASTRIAPPHETGGEGDPTNVAAETNTVKEKRDQALALAVEPANRQPVDTEMALPTVGQPFAPASNAPHRGAAPSYFDD